MPNDHWSKLDNTVYRKLHIENTITERLHFLEKKFSYEALIFFDYKTPARNLTFQSCRSKHSIELVIQKNDLLVQISLSVDPQEQTSSQNLLDPMKENI